MRLNNLLSLFLILTLSGCSSLSSDMESFNLDIRTGNYKEAQSLASDLASNNNRDTLLWQLQAGIAARHNMDYGESNRLFDLAELNIKNYEDKTMARSTGQSVSSTLTNDTVSPYSPQIYDTIMVNTYKGLNYLALGDTAGARVEFNRAIDRQRRAGDFFSKEIEQEAEAIARQSQPGQSRGVHTDRTLNNQELTQGLNSRVARFPALQAYPDFINPFTTYMAGLFAIFDRDFNKASHLLKQTRSMLPSNPFVAEDFRLVEQTINSGQPFPPSVWVIVENGHGPYLDEFRIDIPVFLVSNKVLYTGIALPELKSGEPAVTTVTINSDKKETRTLELSNMESVVHREFAKRYGAIVRKALLSALLKSSLQYVAQKNGGDLGLIAATIFQIATTRADTRIWTGLPHNFQMARIQRPQDGTVSIYSASHQAMETRLGNGPYTLIYVTISSYTSEPVIQVYSY